MPLSLEKYILKANSTCPIRVEGRVTKVIGTIIEGDGPPMPVGGICRVISANLPKPIIAEVVGFREGQLLLSATRRKWPSGSICWGGSWMGWETLSTTGRLSNPS
jgi:flagellar biosynthesis/type III secretory pathway ATPase